MGHYIAWLNCSGGPSGDTVSTAVIPLLASPQGGVAERVRKISRGRGGFPTAHERKTTPSASASVASQNFLDDADTPPCGDARRGITTLKHCRSDQRERSASPIGRSIQE